MDVGKSRSWRESIESVGKGAKGMAKEELVGLVKSSSADSDEFIRRQGEKLDLYLSQLAAGKITKRQFEGYVRDIRDLTEMRALKMAVAAKARAQRLVNGITELILNGLLARLP